MALNHNFTAGYLALFSDKVPVAAYGGGAKVSATSFEGTFTGYSLPLKGFSYSWRGQHLRFYKGQPRELHPDLRTILLAEGLVS